jgi:large subunit ribosomal protein L18Ae
VNEIREKDPRSVKNYALWIRYDSRSGTHNMYREFRSLTLNDAVDQMYSEMAGRHRARPRSIQIIRTAIIADEDCKRPHILQFVNGDVKFALPHRLQRASSKKLRTTFKATRPNTHFN